MPKALNTKAVLFALGLGAAPRPDATTQKGLRILLTTVKGDQTEAGSWAAWSGYSVHSLEHSARGAEAGSGHWRRRSGWLQMQAPRAQRRTLLFHVRLIDCTTSILLSQREDLCWR